MKNTLDKINKVIRRHAGSKIDSFAAGVNLDLLATEARSCWASVLFSNAGNQAIVRFANYQLRELNKCLLILDNDEAIDAHMSNDTLSKPSDIRSKLFALFDAFFEDFSDYIDENPICPRSYHFHVCTSTRSECKSIEKWLGKIPVNKIILDMIKGYLERMNDFANYRFQYAEVAYYQKFVQELKSWSSIKIGGDWTLSLTEKLIQLNFNHLDLFNFQQQLLREKFGKLDLQTAVSAMRQELIKMPYHEKRNKLRLDYRWPQTSNMLCNWLSGELKSIETQIEVKSKALQETPKLPFRLSVAHLACLIRLFAKEHVFGEITLTEIFDFFGRNCSSKRQSVISAGGISKEFYSMSQVVAAEMRDILQRMINRINRDYFPAVVVMLLTAGFC